MSDAHGHGSDTKASSHGHSADAGADAGAHGGGHGGHGDAEDERPHRSHAHSHEHDHAPAEESAKKESGSNAWWNLKFDETTCFSLLGFILSWSVLDWGRNGERKKVDLILK